MASARPGPILVTGANSGIGLASVLRLAERGWTVWGTVRSEAKGDALLAAARDRDLGRRVHPLVLDVSDHDAVVDAWKDLPDFYGVVNNAGYVEMGAVEEVSAARAKAQLDVNLVAPAIVSACALPGMRRRGEGRIVMVSSVAGRAAILPLNAWYHASKFGLEALSDILRVEVASFGVKVAIVEPGFFKTNITDRMREQTDALGSQPDSPYHTAYGRVTQMTDWLERVAPAADGVARAITSAIESSRPQQRYLVGLDALSMVASQSVTPRGVTDFALRMISGLTKPS